MTDLKGDLDMEPYFRAWEKQKKALENMPLPEVDLKKLRKWYRRSPRQKLLRREVASLIAAVVMLAWLLFHFSKGMGMPVAYIITLLLMLLCVADSVCAIRLITLIDPITSSIPDMLKNCARLRLYEKIEMLVAFVIVVPLALLFVVPISGWMFYSVNLFAERIHETVFGITMPLTALFSVLVSIYAYRSNLRIIKETINELRTYRNQN
ncbi:MAG: hypothetical protein IKX13_01670 [Bacteroidales bacterium]|nr:hypothetical protein [Bacteroidales bacterium]